MTNSTCKGCNENIAKGALRIGASFHDPRGFDNTKWYHVDCFPTSLYPVFPVENLKGFDSIEVCMQDQDREKLQKLEEIRSMGDPNDDNEKNEKDVKNHRRGEAAVGQLDKLSPKKVKGVSEEASVSVEYAKSGRSTCKGCSVNIAKGALRLGSSAHDPCGFDAMKGYHVACFPISYPVFPVENLKGFDSNEKEDREKLRELENHKEGTAADLLNELNLKKEMASL